MDNSKIRLLHVDIAHTCTCHSIVLEGLKCSLFSANWVTITLIWYWLLLLVGVTSLSLLAILSSCINFHLLKPVNEIHLCIMIFQKVIPRLNGCDGKSYLITLYYKLATSDWCIWMIRFYFLPLFLASGVKWPKNSTGYTRHSKQAANSGEEDEKPWTGDQEHQRQSDKCCWPGMEMVA